MIYMHCSIRVSDYTAWKGKMDSDMDSQRKAGLNLISLWRGSDDPNRAFMIFEVHDKKKAHQHLNPSDLKKSSEIAGVLEFDWHFVERVPVHSANHSISADSLGR